MRRSHFLMQKNLAFFEIYGTRTDSGGGRLRQYGNFTDKGEGSIFSILCGRRLLWMPLNQMINNYSPKEVFQ